MKHRKIIKEYCTKKKKSIHIYTQTKLSKRKIDLNPKIKSIQSLTKYPQPNKNNKNTASTIPTRTPKQTHSNNKPPFNPPPNPTPFNPPLLLHNHWSKPPNQGRLDPSTERWFELEREKRTVLSQRERPELEAYGFGFEQNREIKRVQEG